MKTDNWYTCVIELHQGHTAAGQNKIVLEDLTHAQAVGIQQNIWVRGISIKSSPVAREVVSPYIIHKVFIICQDRHHGTANQMPETDYNQLNQNY